MSSDESLPGPAVVVYTQMLCGFCAAACELLKKKGVSYHAIDVTLNAKLRREMIDKSGSRTVPQIFVNEQHIGGYDELAELETEGQLDTLLGLTG
jgi:glutaredoxin 3